MQKNGKYPTRCGKLCIRTHLPGCVDITKFTQATDRSIDRCLHARLARCWDCPRSHIIVLRRLVRELMFDTTVRDQPNQRHAEIDELCGELRPRRQHDSDQIDERRHLTLPISTHRAL